MLLQNAGMKKWESIAEQEVSEYLDHKGYQIELISLLEQFDEEKNGGGDSVDR